MAGNKNSGRRKGSANKKTILNLKKKIDLKPIKKTPEKPKKMQVIENTQQLKSPENHKTNELDSFEPKPLVEKNEGFDDLEIGLIQKSAAALAAEIEQNKIESPATVEPSGDPEKSPAEIPEAAAPVVQKESWKPVVEVGYQIIGELLETNTGMKELNYTLEEIEQLSSETEKIIHVLWPNATGGLTEDQKTLLFSGFIILSVHNKKYQFYSKKKSELENAKSDS